MQTDRIDEHLEPADSGELDGIEVEGEDLTNLEIESPFNPEKIKIRTVNIVVEQLVSRIEHEEIDLAPDFQRLRGIWSDVRKSRLIESLLLRIPIPVFYVSADDQENWAVVDGVQRMSTIYDYVQGRFALERLEYLDGLAGLKHEYLPRNMRRRIGETQLIVNVIEPGTPSEVMFNIFRRINTGGMTLNGQEIRHALNPGPVREYLKHLADSEKFVRATGNSIAKLRMQDRECVLRFLAFLVSPWEEYAANDLNGFLVDGMKRLNNMSVTERDELETIFGTTMTAATQIFGDDAFRKRIDPDHARKPVNKALLEVWCVALARCSPAELRTLVKRRSRLRRQFTKLLNDDREFEVSVSASTGIPRRVKKRFGEIEALIKDTLDD